MLKHETHHVLSASIVCRSTISVQVGKRPEGRYTTRKVAYGIRGVVGRIFPGGTFDIILCGAVKGL
jgi:hypothetical protein